MWAKKVLSYSYHHWADTIRDKVVEPGLPIPFCDTDAYRLYLRYRWMFNKLLLCEAQGLPAYPHGVEPQDVGLELPVFSKPIVNLWGQSRGARRLDEWRLDSYTPGYFWMPLLPGPQLSTDVVIRQGHVEWSYTMRPVTDENGSFIRWETAPLPDETVAAVRAWAAGHLADFTGVANFETRGRWIIEAPPRMALQFVDFYGRDWLERVIALYCDQVWEPPEETRGDGISYVVRVDQSHADRRLWLRDRERLLRLEQLTGTSIALTWRNGQRLGDGTHDDHSYRIAIVNGWEMATLEWTAAELLACIDGLDVQG
ncbi:MAG: hypothetical protein ACRDZ4_12315 [Egibacteraceae bacterium]